MTQSIWSQGGTHPARGHEAAKPEDSPLVSLIRSEFSETRLCRALDLGTERVPERLWSSSLCGPLLELLNRPGKEFRSRLVEVAYDVSRRRGSPPMPSTLPLLVEILHAGSLIIDDIEDDSKYRRGKPALHLVVGLPLALNAGNWLYFLPHSLLEEMRFEAAIELDLRRAIDKSVLRCHYGQALDLSVRVTDLHHDEVAAVVYATTRLKTGSLMELAAELGALAAGASPERTRVLADVGRDVGVALQMLDDLSGIAVARRAHKGREDLLAARPSWVWAWLAQSVDRVTYRRLRSMAESVARGELEPDGLAALLAERVGAEEALRSGLVHRVAAPGERALALALQWAEQLARGAPLALARMSIVSMRLSPEASRSLAKKGRGAIQPRKGE